MKKLLKEISIWLLAFVIGIMLAGGIALAVTSCEAHAKTKVEKACETQLRRYAKKHYGFKKVKYYTEGKCSWKKVKQDKRVKRLSVEKITLTIKDRYGAAKTSKGKDWYIDGIYDDLIKGKKCWVYLVHSPKTNDIDKMYYAIPSGCRRK